MDVTGELYFVGRAEKENDAIVVTENFATDLSATERPQHEQKQSGEQSSDECCGSKG